MSKVTLAIVTVVTALAGIGCSHDDRSTASNSERVATTPSSGDEAVCGASQVYFASGSSELDDAARARSQWPSRADHRLDRARARETGRRESRGRRR